MKKFFALFLFILLGISQIQAQSKIVSGTILDETGQPLPGASVVIKGTSRGESTDLDGKFTLKAEKSDVLVVTFVGYVKKEIPIGDQTVLTISLVPDTNNLDEVVLVSFGAQKKKSIVSAVSTVKPAELKVSSSNLTTALAGRISGIIGYQRGGEPGNDDAQFFIRGVTTFGYGSSPLILIDGVELTVNDLRRLNPDDIASFSIMKDASATALYGARGANGVIYVTTKEGFEGSLKVSARFETSFSQSTQDIELADPITYMKMGNEAVRTRDPLGLLPYSLSKIANTIAGTDPVLYPTTDWQEELFKDYTVNTRFNMNLSGGGKIARYFVSLSENSDNGILNVPSVSNFNNNIKYKQFNLRSNVNINLTETSQLKLGFNFSFDDFNGPPQSGTTVYNQVMKTNPVLFRPFYEKDEEHQYTDHILFGNYGDGDYLNPYAEMVRGYKEGGSSKIIAQLEFNQKLDFITEGLNFKAIYMGTKQSSYYVTRAYHPYYYTPFHNNETGETSLILLNEDEGTEYLDYTEGPKNIVTSHYLEARLSYNREFNEDHSVSGLLVYTMNDRLYSNAGSLQKSLPYRNMGLAGRFTYGFKNKYFAEANFGYNGSERFSEKERWGFFPSVGFGWVASDENFFDGIKKTVTFLKFRGSYGLVGNDLIGSSDDRFFYLSQVNLNDGDYGYTTGEKFNNSLSGISVSRYPNDQITWETAKKLNVGFEMHIVNEFVLTADYFTEKRYDILANRIIPGSLGYQAPVRSNIGEAINHGIDGSLVYTTNFGKDGWLQARGNYTYATNEITKIEEPDYSATPWLSRVGQPINQTWGYVAERLFVDQDEVNNSPVQSFGGVYSGGDIKYRDINGDGAITSLDQVPIGNPTAPEIVYGFGLSAGIRGFDASFFFQGAANSSFWVIPSATAPFVNEQQLLKVWADDYWSENNRNVYAKWPRLSDNLVANNNQTSTWFMQDGAFLRLKSVEVGYSLPASVLNKLRMDQVRFYATGTNLFVLSDFKLWDPELAGNGLGYPNQRVISGGINISF